MCRIISIHNCWLCSDAQLFQLAVCVFGGGVYTSVMQLITRQILSPVAGTSSAKPTACNMDSIRLPWHCTVAPWASVLLPPAVHSPVTLSMKPQSQCDVALRTEHTLSMRGCGFAFPPYWTQLMQSDAGLHCTTKFWRRARKTGQNQFVGFLFIYLFFLIFQKELSSLRVDPFNGYFNT